MRSMRVPDPTSHWTDQVIALCYSYRDTLIAHPNLAPAMVRLVDRRFDGRGVAGLARAMAIDGIPTRVVPGVLSSLELYVFGAGVSAHADCEKSLPGTMPELDDFPEVLNALLTAQNNEATFCEGLKAFLAGWQARIARLQPERSAES
jgi:hypothetical protein